MKTAIQELIELIENGETRLDLIENHKQIWLEKEKKQILKAFIEGQTLGFDDNNIYMALRHYNKTYNQNES